MERVAWNKGLKGYSNEGTFKKGTEPWNKGKRKNLNLKKINNLHWENGISIRDIAKRYSVSDRLIRIRLKENGYQIRSNKQSKQTRQKIGNTLKENKVEPKERYSGEIWNKGLTKEDERVKKNIQGLINQRKYQVIPFKDTSIEIKLQTFLKILGIKFFTHQ